MTLSDFLAARVAEDEEGARLSPREWWSGRLLGECEAKRLLLAFHGVVFDLAAVGQFKVGQAAEFAAGAFAQFKLTGDDAPKFDCPCFYDELGRCFFLRAMALPYADHPDYRDEWRP